ncbi:MAG: hypothetical protein DMD34_05450 [Gemmatimonadetes bacterium]|nr:MAG: hypothetical protein DMD46_00280 [Gemmatimonadota bacterium]PYP96407.1 MAG: hypothetical protein DMD34_05450 [Gemmatimonadota bacterium]
MWATNAKIVGIVLGTLALYTLIANKIPQVQSEVPQALSLGANVTPEQLVAAGEKVFNGIGGCTTCHGLGTRAPNLLTDETGTGPIGVRCAKREPGKSCKQYLYESLDQPTAYVVAGYQPIMPVMTKQLSPAQVWSVIAFLESQGGTVDVTASDIPSTATTSATSTTATGGAGAAGGAAFAGGSTDPKAIIQAAGCLACHKLEGQGQVIAPDLTHVGSRRDAESIRKKILDPASSIAKGYEKLAGIMPKAFGTMMNAAQLEAVVQFLAGHK